MVTWNVPPMKWPSSSFAAGPALIATLVVPVRITDRPSTSPATANSLPRVTMNDGTAVRTTSRPLTKPTSAPMASANAIPSRIGRW